ncbi:MAG: hypothetical protein ACWGNV_12460 [Bacteroidales bacterium]
MKRLWISMTAAALLILAGSSCTEQEERGTLKFGIQQNGSETLKAAVADGRIGAALVTVIGEDGQSIYEKERLNLYSFGDGYVTTSLELPVGNFHLEEFMLIDSAGAVLWATPREGSELAGLVSQPLPLIFGIFPGETTTVPVEVVRTSNYQPSDFGYASFEIGFVEQLCFQVSYYSSCLTEWNDSILGPDGTVVPEAPVYMPMLSVWTKDRRILYEQLNQGLNHYHVPVVKDIYYMEATDCTGQVVYRGRMGLDQLLQYPCRDNAPSLVIDRDSVTGILVTPEGLTSPSISQGVFGQLTIGLDYYMLTDSADQMPVVRDIYFYPYSVVDSLYAMSPIDCHFPIELIGSDPVAVVRTNSEGYYQARLAAGQYLYLVEDGDLFYLDGYMSSHPPGQVEVYRDAVTIRNIQVIDCSMWMRPD